MFDMFGLNLETWGPIARAEPIGFAENQHTEDNQENQYMFALDFIRFIQE